MDKISNVWVGKKIILKKQTWLITGVAGFIGSHLLEALLRWDQNVVGIDNFSTGHLRNLREVELLVEPSQWSRFKFINGDIRNFHDCQNACKGVDFILHQAALGSVPRSIEDPIRTNEVNISGFLNMLVCAKEANVNKFVFAASSSTYGDHPGLPKVEGVIGKPLSPYAITKYVNELYAEIFFKVYGLQSIGLRYFNVFGPRQDPNGAYAAVIPRWIQAMIDNKQIQINGDGETTRDFCYVDNVVQANILAALTEEESAKNQVFNIAVGENISLNNLFREIKKNIPSYNQLPDYRDFRIGDVRNSLASIQKAINILGYNPQFTLREGIIPAIDWYKKQLGYDAFNSIQ